MEVEKPHPLYPSPPPLAQFGGFELPLRSVYMGFAAGGWALPPWLFKGLFQCGEATGWPEAGRPRFCIETEE